MSSKHWGISGSLSPHYRLSLLFSALAALALAVAPRSIGAQAATLADKPAETAAKNNPATSPESKADPVAPDKTGLATTATPVAPDSYRIGMDDSLSISVWHEPELSSVVVVRPDGVITLPLINEVNVVGLKPIELQELLTEKLKSYVSEPQVTVIVTGIKSRKVYLVGQVAKQGSYPLEGNETVLQLLATSGGVGPFAKTGSIYVLRGEQGKQVRIPFKYKKALQGRSGNGDILLQPGDVVVVP